MNSLQRIGHFDEEQNVEIGGVLKQGLSDVANLFESEPGDGFNLLPNVCSLLNGYFSEKIKIGWS